jgi:hypothetical protein
MAIICIAGAGPGVGKTAVAEFLLSQLEGWFAARVRVGDEVSDAEAALLGEAAYHLRAAEAGDPEAERLRAAGARGTIVLVAEARGLAAGLKTLLASLPEAASPRRAASASDTSSPTRTRADVAVMVIGPGRSGRGLAPVRPSARELFSKVDLWAWNTHEDPAAEGFFEFPQALARMGFAQAVSNRADYHHVNPCRGAHAGNREFLEAVRERIDGPWWRRESDEFLRRIGFDF